MLTLRRGRVTAVVESVEGLSRVEVDGRPCVAYPRLTGSVEVGDDVIVNTQARELALGSGGFDVLYVNLTRGLDLPADPGAHVVKLPYTPGQSAVGHGGLAAADAANTASALQGSPVLAVRASESDERDRHRGASHHTRSVLELCLGDVVVPWPAGYDAPSWLKQRTEVDVTGWEELCADLPLSHMGRGRDDDRLFFAAAFAAGRAA